MSRKKDILEKALDLFNRYGSEKTSTRHIATSMDISVGNLHYHYPSKTDLIFSLQRSFLQETQYLADELNALPPDPVTRFYSTIEKTFNLIFKYRFLFHDRLYLSRSYPDFADMFIEMISRRKEEFKNIVRHLQVEGFLRKDLSADQYDYLFDQISIIYNSWPMEMAFAREEVKPISIKYYVRIAAALWFPYFTKKGFDRFLPIPEIFV